MFSFLEYDLTITRTKLPLKKASEDHLESNAIQIKRIPEAFVVEKIAAKKTKFSDVQLPLIHPGQ